MTETQWFDNVRRIQPAAHANFEHGDVDLRVSKRGEGERRHGFKEAGRSGQLAFIDEPAGGVVNLKVETGKVVVRDVCAVDADALVHSNQMR